MRSIYRLVPSAKKSRDTQPEDGRDQTAALTEDIPQIWDLHSPECPADLAFLIHPDVRSQSSGYILAHDTSSGVDHLVVARCHDHQIEVVVGSLVFPVRDDELIPIEPEWEEDEISELKGVAVRDRKPTLGLIPE